MNSKFLAILALVMQSVIIKARDCPFNDKYPCCEKCNKTVYYTDKDGDWGVENHNWCHIQDCNCPFNDKYPCCENCKVVTTDEVGDWGVENHRWCHIPDSCKSQSTKQLPPTTKQNQVSSLANATCAKLYEICDGPNYLFPYGPRCCEQGSCNEINSTESRCIPELQSKQCSFYQEPCGGSLYPDAPECCDGFVCAEKYPFISVCTYNIPNIFNEIKEDIDMCVGEYEICGGTDYPYDRCCKEGSFCVEISIKEHRCIPEDNVENMEYLESLEENKENNDEINKLEDIDELLTEYL